MDVRIGLLHPFGLALLLASLLLAAAAAALPAAQAWSARAPWLVLLGVLAYAATAFVVTRSRLASPAPELRMLWAIRRTVASRLAKRQAAEHGGRSSELTLILADALLQLDRQVIPTLAALLERQKALGADLARYASGELPQPDPAVMDRLRGIYDRQHAAIEECLQQAVNADATLVALLQESDDHRTVEQARRWVQDLLALHDTLAEVLRGDGDVESFDFATAGLAESPPAPAAEANGASGQPSDASAEPSAERLVRQTEEALRRLNNPAALAQCELIARLPRTLAQARARGGDGKAAGATPLEQAQTLREVLAAAIERLKPAGGPSAQGTPEVLQYHILREEYLLGMSNKYIMVRHSISHSTFHRHRRDAIAIIARELGGQEDLLAQQAAPVPRPPRS